MNIPEGLKFTKDHEWVKIEGAVATVGITEFAQSELGDIVFAELPAVGKNVTKGATLTVVESTKAASDVYAPIGGTVKSVNAKLKDNPQLINQSPYGDGWLVTLEKFSAAELDSLMTAAQYKELVAKKH